MAARCFRTHRTKEETEAHNTGTSPSPTRCTRALTFLSCCCCTMRAFLGAITRPGEKRALVRPENIGPTLTPESPARFSPPFLGPRFRAEAAAAAALLFAGFRAWNLRCPCAIIRHASEEGEVADGRRRARWDTVGLKGAMTHGIQRGKELKGQATYNGSLS